jgi:hypothetical protein
MRIIAPVDGKPIVSWRGNIYERTREISRLAGVPWKRNALRTSFASYHLHLFRNAALTSELDGHTVEQLNRDYKTLRGVSDTSAAQWFAVTPARVVEYAKKHGLQAPAWAVSAKS